MFGAAFLSVRQHAMMPRDGDEATLHVGIRCGAGKFQIFDCAMPISPCARPASQFFQRVRDENAQRDRRDADGSLPQKNRLFGRFDIRAIVEKIADRLVLINDERYRQIALAKAMFDAEIDVLKREMASAKLNFDGAFRRRLSLGLQGAGSLRAAM
jgi:hypothetical protein